jgi:hypothetical protein
VRSEPYEVDLTRTARRALAESLPLDVAIGVSDFLTDPLADNPHRVGKELDVPYHGVYSSCGNGACSTSSTTPSIESPSATSDTAATPIDPAGQSVTLPGSCHPWCHRCLRYQRWFGDS